MNISINPLTWFSSIEKLRSKSQGFDASLRQLFNDVTQWAQQIQAGFTSSSLVSILNGNKALLATAVSTLSVSGTTETTNRTINTNSALNTSANLIVTGAVNYSLSFTNLVAGSLVALRLVNSSGASRTFSVLASSPSASAYTVWLIGTGAILQVNTGAAIANGAAWNGIGIANGAVGQLLLVGGVGT